MFWAITRAVKVTIFYKKEAFSTFLLSIFGSSEDDFSGRRDGHFCARDGHYDSNDHREHLNGRFQGRHILPFSPPLPPRRAYRRVTEAPDALARWRNDRNVYLYIFGKIFTIPARRLKGRKRAEKDKRGNRGHVLVALANIFLIFLLKRISAIRYFS